MKKVLFFAILVCAVTAFSFADFTVQSVTGNVMRESGSQRVAVSAGDVLANEIVIHTGVGAALVLTDSTGRTINVPAARNGTVADLARAASGVRIGGNVSLTDTTAVTRTTTGAGTASARASDAASADDIAAE